MTRSTPPLCLRALLLVCTLPVLALLSGCGAASVSTAKVDGTAMNGHVFGGQQAITGAVISLYAAGLTGNGASSTSLLTLPVLSTTDGAFSITGDYACPSAATQVYIVARGGNPGLPTLTSNAASVLMAPLGDCGNLQPSTFITINEVTTAASAWALAQFFGANGTIGASATNATGLRNAFLVANNLVNVASGLAGGSALPTGAVLESSKLYTLADVLAVCVNSNGGSACSALFAAAGNGSTPANTLDAAVSIVRNPGLHVADVFNANNAQGPFQPTLPAAPNDWTMTLTYTGGGLYAPSALGVDSTGSVWAADYFGGWASKLSVSGVPAAANGFPNPRLYESYGLAIDAQDNAWITIEDGSGVNSGDGSIAKFSSSGTVLSGNGFFGGGIFYPYAIAADPNGTMWVADYGRSGATLLANDGTSLNGATRYMPNGLSFPTAVAVDGNHNAWFGAQNNAVLVAPDGTSSFYSCCSNPSGVAMDPAGNVWIADYSASQLVELTSGGAVTQRLTAGGLVHPEILTTDSLGQVWAANYRGNSISGFTNAGASLSPTTGFGLDTMMSQPFGIAGDASGNLWVSNFALSSLTQFVGLAAPTRTPRLGLPVAP